jgi:hypothetical protein
MWWSVAWAAETWTPTCTAPNDPTIWLVLEAPAPVAPPEFTCPALFLGGVPCDRIVGLATVRTSLYTARLAWLPAGEAPTVLGFLDNGLGGVPLRSDAPTPTALADTWLADRARASAAQAGVTLHVWGCPEAPTVAPDTAGLTVRPRTGRVVLRQGASGQ